MLRGTSNTSAERRQSQFLQSIDKNTNKYNAPMSLTSRVDNQIGPNVIGKVEKQ